MNLDVTEIKRRIGAATKQFRTGEVEAAKAEMRKLESLSPRNDDEWRPVVSICKRFGLTAQAEIVTERYIRQTGGSAEAFLESALLHHVGRRKEQAQAALEAAVAFGMDTAERFLQFAQTLMSMHDYPRAVEVARRGLAFAPGNFDLLTLLGLALQRAGSPRKADTVMRELLTRTDLAVRQWLLVADLALKLEDVGGARIAAQNAKKVSADAPDHYKLQVLEMLARTDLMQDFREAFAATPPSNAEQEKVAEKIFAAAIRAGTFDIARTVGERILDANPKNDYVIREVKMLRKIT